MIGDCVLVEDIHDGEKGARVKQIYKCGIDCGKGDNECKPIKLVPLTAEIMNHMSQIKIDK